MSQLQGYNKPLVVKVFSFNEANETYTEKSASLCQKLKEAVISERDNRVMPDVIFICTQESNIGRVFNISSRFHENIACPDCLGRDYLHIVTNEVRANGFFAGLYKPKNVKTSVFMRRSMAFSPESLPKASCAMEYDNDMRSQGLTFFPSFGKNAAGLIIPPEFRAEVNRDPRFNMLYNKVYGDLKVDINIFRFEGKAKSYKSAVAVDLEFGRYRLIVVNNHLFFTNDDPEQGYKERVADFVSVVKHFDLAAKHRAGWNIIFCGDLNFRNNPVLAIQQNTSHPFPQAMVNACTTPTKSSDVRKLGSVQQVEKCARAVYDAYRNDPESLKYINELSKLPYDVADPVSREFIGKLVRSASLRNITCAYKTGKDVSDHRPAFSNLAIMKENSKFSTFKVEKDYNHKAPRIPSTCDQILYLPGQGSQMVPWEGVQTFTSLLQSDHIAIYESFDVYPTS